MTAKSGQVQGKIAKRACNSCRMRHIKCCGQEVCANCIKFGRVCLYSTPRKRGPRPKATTKAQTKKRAKVVIDVNIKRALSAFQQHTSIFYDGVRLPEVGNSTAGLQSGSELLFSCGVALGSLYVQDLDLHSSFFNQASDFLSSFAACTNDMVLIQAYQMFSDLALLNERYEDTTKYCQLAINSVVGRGDLTPKTAAIVARCAHLLSELRGLDAEIVALCEKALEHEHKMSLVDAMRLRCALANSLVQASDSKDSSGALKMLGRALFILEDASDSSKALRETVKALLRVVVHATAAKILHSCHADPEEVRHHVQVAVANCKNCGSYHNFAMFSRRVMDTLSDLSPSQETSMHSQSKSAAPVNGSEPSLSVTPQPSQSPDVEFKVARAPEPFQLSPTDFQLPEMPMNAVPTEDELPDSSLFQRNDSGDSDPFLAQLDLKLSDTFNYLDVFDCSPTTFSIDEWDFLDRKKKPSCRRGSVTEDSFVSSNTAKVF